MLSSLKIENVAVIEHSEIVFNEGLNILTGETGAGKSIVIDSINAILGERTSRELVRTGCDKARVTAFFDFVPNEILPLLDKYDVDYDGNGLLVTRVISADGRGSCKINGCTITVTMLREIMRSFITICGQHDSQFLLSKEHHLTFIDAMAESDELLNDYSATFYKVKSARKKLKELLKNENDKERKLDILKYQIDEISGCNIRVGEKDELIEQKRTAQNFEKILSSIRYADCILNGDDNSEGILTSIKNLSKIISDLSSYSSHFEIISNGINEVMYNLEDYSGAINSYLYNIDSESLDLNYIEERLDIIYKLSKKYGPSEADILKFLSDAEIEYESINNNDAEISNLEVLLDELEDELFKKGCYLSDARKNAAIDFQNRVMCELNYLDMPNAEFIVEFTEIPATEKGFDSVEFLFSANSGQEPKPLTKIASGGELSRVMLAIRCVLSDIDFTSTMIFDEIDTGVSGRAAHKIAYKMHQLSKNKQILCVTHLAQIAAYADNHLFIEKVTDEVNTYTKVKNLEPEECTYEIARIMGGDNITPTTLQSAEELIEFAKNEGF